MQGRHLLILLASAVAVFSGSFVLGKATSSSGASTGTAVLEPLTIAMAPSVGGPPAGATIPDLTPAPSVVHVPEPTPAHDTASPDPTPAPTPPPDSPTPQPTPPPHNPTPDPTPQATPTPEVIQGGGDD